MFLRSTILACSLAALCWSAVADELTSGSAAASAPHRRRALLVGCTEYAGLGDRYRLRGPANDVELIERLLRERFRFADEEIIRLLHTAAAERRPTRANILREFEKLAVDARPGDEIVILLAGHGSQVPDDSLDEDDGLDEVFLPEDATRQGAKASDGALNVPGIRDDEIEQKLTAIRSRGAFVFFIADTCHSGTMSRGLDEQAGATIARHVPSELLSSAVELTAAANRARSSDRPREQTAHNAAASGGLAAVYAVPSSALEQEQPMPPPLFGADRPYYGRLSYAIFHVLSQADHPITYRELAQQIAWQYRAWDFYTLPLLEGSALDREVLGKREWQDRSTLLVAADDFGRLQLNQGAAHGLTKGTLLKVSPPVGDKQAEIAGGLVVVGAVEPFTAEADRFESNDPGQRADAPLPNPGRCEIVAADAGAAQVTIRVIAAGADDQDAADALGKQLDGWSAANRSLVRRAAPDESADVVLHVRGRSAELGLRCRPFADEPQSATSVLPPFRPYQLGDTLPETLTEDLRRIAVAYNLLRLATDDEPEPDARFASDEIGLAVAVERARGSNAPWEPLAGVLQQRFTSGDQLRITLRNVGESRIDATVLYIESAMRIQSCFPTLRAAQSGAYNTLDPGQSREVVLTINDKTVGWEDILVLAVAHTPPLAAHFAFLEQPGLTASDFRRDRGSAGSPLDELLAASLAGERRTRKVAEAKAYAVRRIPLEVYRSPAGTDE